MNNRIDDQIDDRTNRRMDLRIVHSPDRRTRRARPRVRQHDLAFKSWGGARPGAGRKPRSREGGRSRVTHATRPALDAAHPVHATVRLREGLPSLRRVEARRAVARAFASSRERFGFRLIHFSLQSNHVHLIAEARDRRALSRGMQALLVRVARALNRLWGRRGAVFADRFHARPLRTPREVRCALLYVLQNARHHGLQVAGIDPYSSGPWFDGWKGRVAASIGNPGAPPATWLLRSGWRRHGPIDLEESPRRTRLAAGPKRRRSARIGDGTPLRSLRR
jgi:REP element-mobilizing transposase RayT